MNTPPCVHNWRHTISNSELADQRKVAAREISRTSIARP